MDTQRWDRQSNPGSVVHSAEEVPLRYLLPHNTCVTHDNLYTYVNIKLFWSTPFQSVISNIFLVVLPKALNLASIVQKNDSSILMKLVWAIFRLFFKAIPYVCGFAFDELVELFL